MNALVPYLAALHQQDLLEQAELGRRAKLSTGSQPSIPDLAQAPERAARLRRSIARSERRARLGDRDRRRHAGPTPCRPADRVSSIGMNAPRGLAATTWGPGRLDLFWVDDDRGLWHSAAIDGAWSEPESLGGALASSPTAAAWAEGEMEVFAVMDDGELWNRYWDHTYWHPWESLGGELDPAATPASSSSGGDRLDVYARGRDGKTWHRWWDGTEWVPWEQR